MKIVEYIAATPEENIAMDELLLKKAESGDEGETLRFWSSEKYFVAAGRACRVAEDCFLERCRVDDVRIIRRTSGGGTVLQGPGCLNYSAVLSYDRDERYRVVRDSYRRILKRVSEAFGSRGHEVEFFPVSDLAFGGRKISGNAQARKRKYFLHHGTFLFDFDLGKISYYLKHPRREPDYRNRRLHERFLTNIPITFGELKELITGVFSPSGDVWRPGREDLRNLDELVREKFSDDNWNYAF
ncbi:MAG: lipoate--protein ligase family protein [Candidatus Omnitrophota bacterium]|nr:lipoate--protein ligase family protein [Candidatus Omnitrophota bacterium]